MPSILERDQITAVLASTSIDTTVAGLRDHAILQLLATYGLRAGEVRNMRIEDIDWRAEVVRVRHSKTQAYTLLPLLEPVGEATTKELTHLVANKKADIVRIYLPPDANTLLWVGDHCLRTYDRINVIVAGKQPESQYLSIDEATAHCEAGVGIWDWASYEEDTIAPDVVMACAGDVPTMETLAAVMLLHEAIPSLKIRTVNIVDLMALQDPEQHPHGLEDAEFDRIFTSDKPVIFAYHGYPYLIHRLTYRRTNHDNIHVRGFIEEGTTTTPFDMTVSNKLDRYHLALEAIARIPGFAETVSEVIANLRARLDEHNAYVREHGEDLAEIRNWRWKRH